MTDDDSFDEDAFRALHDSPDAPQLKLLTDCALPSWAVSNGPPLKRRTRWSRCVGWVRVRVARVRYRRERRKQEAWERWAYEETEKLLRERLRPCCPPHDERQGS